MCPTCRAYVDISSPECVCRDRPVLCVLGAGEYTGPLRHAVIQYKYHGQRAAARSLAGLMLPSAKLLLKQAPAGCIVSPVPLHPRRERERGYNQSALLARELCALTESTLDVRSLRRVKRTIPQVGLNAQARAENVRSAFEADPGAYSGQIVILVDDVCTTGITLREAARSARAAGAKRVIGLVLAIAIPGRHNDA